MKIRLTLDVRSDMYAPDGGDQIIYTVWDMNGEIQVTRGPSSGNPHIVGYVLIPWLLLGDEVKE